VIRDEYRIKERHHEIVPTIIMTPVSGCVAILICIEMVSPFGDENKRCIKISFSGSERRILF